MLKSELIAKIAVQNKLSLLDAERVVSTIFDEIAQALKQGKRVELRGFGVFAIHERKARVARNPKTAEKVEVAAKRVPVFKAGKTMHKLLNGDES